MIKSFNNIFNFTIIGLLIIVGVFMFSNINTINFIETINDDLKTNSEKDVSGQNNMYSARIFLLYIDRELKHLLIVGNDAEKTKFNIRKFKSEYFEQVNAAAHLYDNRKGRGLLKQVYDSQNEYFNNLEQTIRLSDIDKQMAASLAFGETKRKYETLDGLLNKMGDIKQNSDISKLTRIISQSEISIIIALFILLAIVNVGVLLVNKNQGKI
jgi:hypothetical protein